MMGAKVIHKIAISAKGLMAHPGHNRVKSALLTPLRLAARLPLCE
jgi:hypothetical protein